MPDTSLWCQESAYDYFDDLPLEGLAWEFLRRNPDYQRDYQSGAPALADWGLRVAVNPEATAREVPIHWSPSLVSSDLILSILPVPAVSEVAPIDLQTMTGNNTTTSAIIGTGSSELRVSFLDISATPDATLCVVIPLDASIPERIEALSRLWRLLHDKPAPDHRLSRDKRNRLRQMARASDGRASGASAREIAAGLFGKRRVGEQDWRTSSLRYTTLRLLRDGDELVAGGYRELLHFGRGAGRRTQFVVPCVRN